MKLSALAAVALIAACVSSSYAAQDFCGRVTSLPDGWEVKSGRIDVILPTDDSIPPDPGDVLTYLEKNLSDKVPNCLCINGEVRTGTGVTVFTKLNGLRTCQGKVVR